MSCQSYYESQCLCVLQLSSLMKQVVFYAVNGKYGVHQRLDRLFIGLGRRAKTLDLYSGYDRYALETL